MTTRWCCLFYKDALNDLDSGSKLRYMHLNTDKKKTTTTQHEVNVTYNQEATFSNFQSAYQQSFSFSHRVLFKKQ